ncbi:MAG: phosphoribosylanthranilate isomerase [Candidatus Acidiferrum sp.]
MALVKICGITNASDARAACDLGAHALGFNFYEKSPRVIAPAAAWKILRKLPPLVSTVGIFVNWKPAAVTALAESLHLFAVQLHGDEIPRDVISCAKHISVIKAFRINKDFSLKTLAPFRAASAFLLDADAGTGQFGGTGQTADWSVARLAANSHRIILAGGLTPDNVAEAIRSVRPYAVDVASGVESRPGKKDPAKLRAFFSEVARANRELAPGA